MQKYIDNSIYTSTKNNVKYSKTAHYVSFAPVCAGLRRFAVEGINALT